jgi:hypothetical protein
MSTYLNDWIPFPCRQKLTHNTVLKNKVYTDIVGTGNLQSLLGVTAFCFS